MFIKYILNIIYDLKHYCQLSYYNVVWCYRDVKLLRITASDHNYYVQCYRKAFRTFTGFSVIQFII